MNDEVAISVTGVSKAYRIWNAPASRLISPLLEAAGNALPVPPVARWLRARAARHFTDFHALRDVNFEMRRGEAMAIIGRNGSGKSTLLQIIAGTMQPTTGAVRVHGRVAALLELGSGFNPDFTGRENVFLNGTVLGLSRAEIAARFDAIAAYADIGDFIDQPVKIYSSGMAVRLAFAVCAHVDAQVLIIDEALGVGDARFQLKCARTIDRFLEEGRTLLFVSHDLNAVKRLCNRALLLERGQGLFLGQPNSVANLYTKLITSDASAIAADIEKLQQAPATPAAVAPEPRPAAPAPAGEAADVAALREDFRQLQQRLEAIAAAAQPDPRVAELIASERAGRRPATAEYMYGGELGTIVERSIAGVDGTPKGVFASGETVTVHLRVQAREDLHNPIYALTLKNSQGQEIYGTNTHFSRQPAPPIAAGEAAEVKFQFPLNVIAGDYFISLGWTQFVGEELVVVHRRYDTLKITVLGIDHSFGIAHLFARISVAPIPGSP